MVRPTDEKFMNNTNFLMGEFKPIATELGEFGGRWLGHQYYKKFGKESITIKSMKEGIKAQQRI